MQKAASIKLPTPKESNSNASNPLVGSNTRTFSPTRVEDALAGMGSIGERFLGEEDLLVLDDKLGLLYEQKPEIIEDLTRLEGLESKQAKEMNEAGIYTF